MTRCPKCQQPVSELESETVVRAVGAFLTTEQVESVERTLLVSHADDLCRGCLVDAMAEAV